MVPPDALGASYPRIGMLLDAWATAPYAQHVYSFARELLRFVAGTVFTVPALFAGLAAGRS